MGPLPAIGGVRLRELRRAVCAPDRGEVGAGRPVAAAPDPGVEPGLPPVLAGQGPHPVEPAGAVRRVAALRVLPAGPGREGRAGCRDLLPERARLHGSAHDRCRHGDPQGIVRQLLPGPRRRDPDRSGHPGQGRLRRREDGSRHRDVDGRRGSAGPHVVTAQRAGGAGRRALARFACRAHRGRLPDGRARSPQRGAESRLHPRAAGEPAGGVPAAGVRGPARAVRRGPAVGPVGGLGLDGLPDLGVLPRVPGRIGRAVLRIHPGRPRLRRHGPAAAQPDHRARPGVPALRLPLLGASADRAAHQPQVLHRAVR